MKGDEVTTSDRFLKVIVTTTSGDSITHHYPFPDPDADTDDYGGTDSDDQDPAVILKRMLINTAEPILEAMKAQQPLLLLYPPALYNVSHLVRVVFKVVGEDELLPSLNEHIRMGFLKG